MNKKNIETKKIKEKDIVILRFDAEFPVGEADLYKMMKTIREVINKDSTIAKRFICLAKGIDIETMGEDDFVQIWKSKWGETSYEMAEQELELREEELQNLQDDKQLGLFDDPPQNPLNMAEVIKNVKLNKVDDKGNTWKPLSDEDYDKAKKGEL